MIMGAFRELGMEGAAAWLWSILNSGWSSESLLLFPFSVFILVSEQLLVPPAPGLHSEYLWPPVGP